jgi:hypothetical protein
MNREELITVLRQVERVSDVMKRRAIHFVRSTVASQRDGPIDDLEVEAETIPEEVYHILYYMLTMTTLPVNHAQLERDALASKQTHRRSLRIDAASFDSLYWFAYRQRPEGRDILRGILPSPETRRLLKSCQTDGYTVLSNPPVYVRPSEHFGRGVGDGLFALAPLFRGQMILQFTGTVYDLSSGKKFMRGKRQDYVINMRYRGIDFTLDPLDPNTHSHVQPPHYAAYINEPSPPPFANMTNARHEPTKRNILVHRYDHAKGRIRIEFPNGRREDVEPEELSTEATRAVQHLPYRANCAWFDFPVPLDDLYKKIKVKDNGLCVYKRTNKHACTVTFREPAELVTAFESHTNQAYSFEMHRTRVEKIVVGDVLTLRDERLEGIRRHGVVTRVTSGGGWDVHFRLKPDVAWRLPRIVYAGTSSTRGYDVPFPCIYACGDIRPGDELLCLYDDALATRGLRCRTLLDDPDFGLPWYEYVE